METFKKLKRYYWPYRSHLFVSLAFLLLMTLITVVYPVILQITIDRVIGEGKYIWIPYLAIGFVILMMVKGYASYLNQYQGDIFGIKAVYHLRNALYEKLQFLSFGYYDKAKTGDLMSRLTADVEGFRFFLSFGIAEAIRVVTLIVISFGVMFYYSVPLTLVTMITLPFLAVVVYRFEKKVSPAFKGIRQSFGKLNTNVQENISGIQTVKSLSREEFEIDKFNSSNGQYRDQYIYTSNIMSKFFPLMELCGQFSIVLLFIYGGKLVMDGALKPGELVAFYSLVWYIVWPITNIGYIINLFSQSKASGERLLEVLEEDRHIEECEEPLAVAKIEGDVQFENVSLLYPESDNHALKDISFRLPAGKTLGLIGATGSGKTSLTQLITRFYEPTAGRVLIDNHPLETFSLETLRRNIGFVLQESFLFSSTIRDNISYGKPEATIEEIMEAAKRAQAHEFIQQLPDGYDTMLGERGLGLSGGQKQRIAIARAICLNPGILILDDATSAVDMQTEQSIQHALKEVMKDRSTIVIAHRISSVKHCDEILVLQQGRIAERGTHRELISHKGLYRAIYDIQYSDHEKMAHV
ncbi:ABC transporter ATP-binding protein [Bacillus testis]|uniref:ABC transporter ATP-binding protein n=1 Tax=Bacillus testis TaxID=1622072 RepID=UPI00067EA59A|nr:ABC transporter ATP-binding protein [Bacillus testis]